MRFTCISRASHRYQSDKFLCCGIREDAWVAAASHFTVPERELVFARTLLENKSSTLEPSGGKVTLSNGVVPQLGS